MSAAEATVINMGIGAALVQGAVRRVADHVDGRHPAERRQDDWDATAAFVRTMGLDPAAVLLPRPELPVPAVAGVAGASFA